MQTGLYTMGFPVGNAAAADLGVAGALLCNSILNSG